MRKKIILFLTLLTILFAPFNCLKKVNAMPFYDMQPKDSVLRSAFYTSFSSSSQERKDNIKLASKLLNQTFVDSNAEFSFNKTVGERTEKRGFKKAKIISKGTFTEGVGGGVCQVSTTLYNALLLSGLNIIEYHPHSLPVSYIAPSFDAMVNSGYADLKFINNTHNPIIIKSYANDDIIRVEIYGEPMQEKYYRESLVIDEIPSTKQEIILDEKGEYPDLLSGEQKIISYGKKGIISQGVLIKKINGKVVSKKVIRNDRYAPSKTVIVEGTTKK